jgi:hypothetical protein
MTRGPLAMAAVAAAVCAAAAVTFKIQDSDLWQHLLVGKVIWQTHAVPTTQLWTWPTHGAPDVLPSWLFRTLLWPFWQVGGVHGLFAWRWLTTLATFGLLWAAARRAGATGVVPLIALVWCALIWRGRSQLRPETLVAVLMAVELLLLEWRRSGSRRKGGLDPAWGLVPIALLWANAHISYYLGLVIAAAFLLDDLLHARRRPTGAAPATLALATLAAAAASFVNPFGWKALAQPFEYFLVWRHEPVYQKVGELQRIVWTQNVRNGLPLFLVLVVVLAVLRVRRRGVDWAHLVLLGVALPQAFSSQRFVGYLAVIAAPFFARDLAESASRWIWPAWVRAPGRRAALAALACVAISLPELTRPYLDLGYGFGWDRTPVRACDWIAANGVRGRPLNLFPYGGYLLWRFYPDPGRLPFMDIHMTGTKEIRYLYAYAAQDSNAWREIDRRYRFDWVIWPRRAVHGRNILDFLDSDPRWGLVFADDIAVLFLRRDGADSALAARHAYRLLTAGEGGLGALGRAATRDTTTRADLRDELERAAASSEWNGVALSMLANLDLFEARWADAERRLEAARRVMPDVGRAWERIGLAKLYGGDPRGALDAFEREQRARHDWPESSFRRAQALQALGRIAEARVAYQAALARDPANAEARDSLEALRGR